MKSLKNLLEECKGFEFVLLKPANIKSQCSSQSKESNPKSSISFKSQKSSKSVIFKSHNSSKLSKNYSENKHVSIGSRRNICKTNYTERDER